jgi:hypothetical protein
VVVLGHDLRTERGAGAGASLILNLQLRRNYFRQAASFFIDPCFCRPGPHALSTIISR